MGMGTTSSKPRASQFISRTSFPAVSFPLCYHPAFPLGPKHLEKSAAHEHTLGRRKGAGLHSCCAFGSCCAPQVPAELPERAVSWALVLLPLQWLSTSPSTGHCSKCSAPSRNRNYEVKFPPCPCRASLHFIPAPLPTGSTPNSAFLKGTSIARDDQGAILVNLVSAS